MKLSTRARYGIHAMYDLAQNYGAQPRPIKAVAEAQRRGRRGADVEEPTARVHILAIPQKKLRTDIVDVNAPQLTIAVAYGEHHRGVVAPGAGRLAVRPVADHPRALEGAAGAELERHAERVADGLPVYAVAQAHGGTSHYIPASINALA